MNQIPTLNNPQGVDIPLNQTKPDLLCISIKKLFEFL